MKKQIFLFAILALFAVKIAAQPNIQNGTLIEFANGDTLYKRTAANFKTWMNAGGGTVTSVGLALPSEFSISGSPVTGTGTLTGTWATQTTNKVFAAPNGSTGTPTFRALVAADIPTLAASQVTGANLTAATTKVTVTGGTGAVLAAATVDVNEANLTLNNIGGTLGVSKGGTGITSLGGDVTVFGSNGTANLYYTLGFTNTSAAVGASRSGSTLNINIPDADASFRGFVSTGAQTMAGAKTWTGAAAFSSTATVTGLLTGNAGVVGAATSTVAALNAAGVQDGDYVSTTANLTLDHTNNLVAVGTLTAGITISLPGCNSTRDGWTYEITKEGTDVFPITIDPSSSETIGGSLTKVLYSQGTTAKCKCKGGTTSWTFTAN